MSCKVLRDPSTGISRGVGFVQLSTPEEATKAISEMNTKLVRFFPFVLDSSGSHPSVSHSLTPLDSICVLKGRHVHSELLNEYKAGGRLPLLCWRLSGSHPYVSSLIHPLDSSVS